MKTTKNRKNKNAIRQRRGQGRGYNLPSNGYSTKQRTRFTFLDPHMYVTLRYAEPISTSVLTTAGSNQVFRLNSIFDPNAAVGGTQPYGYDQLATLYNRYRVLKTKYKVIFAAATSGYNAVVVPSNGALNPVVSDLTTLTAAAMNPWARYVNYNLGAPPPRVSGKINLNVLGGVARVEYLTDDRFEAQIGANPAEVISLNIGIQNPSAGTITISYMVELEYEVDLHDPILQAPS